MAATEGYSPKKDNWALIKVFVVDYMGGAARTPGTSVLFHV